MFDLKIADRDKYCCDKFEKYLKHGRGFDIDWYELFSELQIVKNYLLEVSKNAVEEYIRLYKNDGPIFFKCIVDCL